jgi:plastocyanin
MRTGYLRFQSLLSALAIGALLASCASDAPPGATPAPVDGPTAEPTPTQPPQPSRPVLRVSMDRMDRFFPDVLVIRPGDTVEWINNSDRLHTVTNDPASAIRADDVGRPLGAAPFDSGYVEPGKTYRQRFTQEGEYRYVCFLHETNGMVGRILVTSKGGP